MTQRIAIPWGPNKNVEFDLPGGWNLKAVLKPNHPPVPDFDAELDRAMSNPIGLPPLKEFAKRGKKAVVLVDDRTRPTPVAKILPRVASELNAAGVSDENIIVLISLGTHRDMTDAEVVERVGEAGVKRFKIVQHHYLDKPNIVSLGKTPTHGIPMTVNKLAVEADTVVSIGCIEAHEQAGAGGGYKNVMPGIAGPEPIHATHNAAFQKPERISSSGCPKERCRFRVAVDECGALLGPKLFIVNAVLDPVNALAIVAGDPLEAHAKGRDVYAKMASVKLESQADIVIAGARPLDIDLRTSMKAWFNASAALKKGGMFITISEASDGLGDLRTPKKLPKSARSIIKALPLGLLEPIAMRVNTSPDQAAGTMSLMKIFKTVDKWLYLTTMKEGHPALAAMGMDFFPDIESLIKRAVELRPKADVVIMPQAGASFVAWD